MKAIFGLHVTSYVTFSVTGAGINGPVQPVLIISKRYGSTSTYYGSGAWSLPLPAGDYFVKVDGDVAGPIDITLSVASGFVSLPPIPAQPPLATWSATSAKTANPKDPWPTEPDVSLPIEIDSATY